ncbi:phosducin-like protein 2 [Esox lucius]|nr:phosducin-like protein 2 [Esox lucius]
MTGKTNPSRVQHEGLRVRRRGRRRRRRRYGQLREIQREQYVREVTCAPTGVKVLLHLYHPSVPMCSLLNRHFTQLAAEFPDTKFLMILAQQCVPNYPASHLPTLFMYESGCILSSLIGEQACGGRDVLPSELKWMLAQLGAFVIDSYQDLYHGGMPIIMPCSEQEDYIDDHSDPYDNIETEALIHS